MAEIRGETIPTVPAVMNRCLPARGPGAPHHGLEHEAAFIEEYDALSASSRFFYTRPVLLAPALDSVLVAFAGSALGLLGTPAHGVQDTPYMGRVVANTKLLVDNLGHTGQGP